MNQTPEARRVREKFNGDALKLALGGDAVVTPEGSRNGADMVSGKVGAVEVDLATMARGFGVLWEDRSKSRTKSGLVDVTPGWRNKMVHARETNNVELLDARDARLVLALGLEAQARVA